MVVGSGRIGSWPVVRLADGGWRPPAANSVPWVEWTRVAEREGGERGFVRCSGRSGENKHQIEKKVQKVAVASRDLLFTVRSYVGERVLLRACLFPGDPIPLARHRATLKG